MSADGLVTISLTPVVYTEGAGPDGPGEFLAPPTPRVGTYDLPVAARGGPPIGRIVGVWHTPVDNVQAITAFARLDVLPAEGPAPGVQLLVSGMPGQRGRLRLRITVLCEIGRPDRGRY